MEAFATLADYEARYGAVAEGDSARVEALLEDASGMLLGAYMERYSTEYAKGEHPIFDAAAKAVTCAVVSRAYNVPLGMAGATQLSQAAGAYNASVTFANPTAELWLGRNDRRWLGLAGTRIGSIPAMTAKDLEQR